MSDPVKINGLSGTKSAKVVIPRFDGLLDKPERGWQTLVPNRPWNKLNHGNLGGLEHPRLMRDGMSRTNLASERGVLPCKSVFGYEQFGRREGPDLESWHGPYQGIARNEKKGLAYDKEAPLNKNLVPKPYSYNVALNSRISIR